MNKIVVAGSVAVLLFAALVVALFRSIVPSDDGPWRPPASEGDGSPDPGAGGVGQDDPAGRVGTRGERGGRRPARPGGGRSGARPGDPDRDGPNGEEGDGRGVLPLPDGSSALAVTTVDRSGRALAGVVLTLRTGRGQEVLETDGRGLSLFDGLAPGLYSLRVEAPKRPPLDLVQRVLLEEGVETSIELPIGDYDLAITGRVLDESGRAAAGVQLVATRQVPRLAASTLVRSDQGDPAAEAGEDGYFEILALEDGEYEVRTVATPVYPPVFRVVKAGAESVDLVVRAREDRRIVGLVTDPAGQPLADVRIVPLGQSAAATSTLRDGTYELTLTVTDPHRLYTVRFLLPGYREAQLDVTPEMLEAPEDVRLDATMEVARSQGVVRGRVSGPDGEPVVGETVYLHSHGLKTRYQVNTLQGGEFEFPEVEVGHDYRLWMRPRGSYQDYLQKPIHVSEDPLEIDVLLEPLGRGRISGRMVDSGGAALGGFSLWLRSLKAAGKSLRVTGDDAGNFLVDDVPEGQLVFETRSLPRLSISGLTLSAGEEKEVTLALDWGDLEVEGRVIDESGLPIAGARVYLSWFQRDGLLRAGSTRKTLTDESGVYRLTQLGPGTHRISVSAAGYRSAQISHDVGAGLPPADVVLSRQPE